MKFAIKLMHEGQEPRWDHYDDPRVRSNLDAFSYGKVMAEYWNNDMRPGETPMRILNAQVLGPGRQRQPLVKVDPRQLDMLSPRSRRTQ